MGPAQSANTLCVMLQRSGLKPSKTKLIEHYKKTLEAFLIHGQILGIDSEGAKRLIKLYFNE
jgi:hypothetical protein